MMKKIILVGLIIGTFAIAMAASSAFTTVYASLTKDPGASGEAPGEEPQIPGWDPDRAEEDAPGQEAEIPVPQPPVPGPPTEIPPAPCFGCANDFAPGQEALDSGTIGPKK